MPIPKGVVTWLIVTAVLLPASAARAQATPDAGQLFSRYCTVCHEPREGVTAATERAADRNALGQMSPEAIYDALATGVMVANATALTDAQKRDLAEYLAGRPLGSALPGDASAMKNHCAGEPLGNPFQGPMWNGWSVDVGNSRFQPAAAAGLTAAQVPRLKLKWAFGFPNATSAYSQPTVVGGRVYAGSSAGFVYALNAASGCVYWSFKAQGGIRSAITVGPPIKGSRPERYPIYFADLKANVYAVDAATGELLWTQQADPDPNAHITGSPTLFEGRLYVPVTGGEEGVRRQPGFQCCKFIGSVVAYDADSGRQIWKSYMIPAKSTPTKKSDEGVQRWGPSGAGVWAAPTIDVRRRVLYATTGNAYSDPAAATTDAVLALDLNTGKLLWSHQFTANDGAGGPDFDIGASAVLRTLPGGRNIMVVSSKSGVTYGIDPDHQGKQLWEHRTGKGSFAGGGTLWGSAADEQMVYVANADSQYGPSGAGGLFALRLATGEEVWHWRPPVPDCEVKGKPVEYHDAEGNYTHPVQFRIDESCSPAQAAAVTVIPGVVFSGTTNGIMRAYSAADGRVLWENNTMRQSYATVNGVPGRGGSIDGPGPTVVGGMLFMTSGYGPIHNAAAGNVLLAFGAD